MNKPSRTIQQLLALAADEDREAAKEFYARFPSITWTVLRKSQPVDFCEPPEYPPVLDVLGIFDSKESRSLVPVFSSPELCSQWAGGPLSTREMKGEILISVIPEDWWMVLDPGQEIEKEISPWELRLLRQGPEALPELIHELYQDSVVRETETLPLDKSQHSDFFLMLTTEAELNPSVKHVYAAEQFGTSVEGEPVSVIAIGIVTDMVPPEELYRIREIFESKASLALIGSVDTPKVFAGIEGTGNIMLGMFKDMEPLYSRAVE